MHRNQADYTLTFRRLCDAALTSEADVGVRALFVNPVAYDEWAAGWRLRLTREGASPEARGKAMQLVNPAFIPRNHRIEQVITAAVEREDYSPFSELLEVLSRPYEEPESLVAYGNPPRPEQRVTQTFCGT
jgi:uncharacterized protein YdiU (UPF0061 family)